MGVLMPTRFLWAADQSIIPLPLQQGINPLTAIDAIKGLLKAPNISLSGNKSTSTPIVPLTQLSLPSFFKVDASLESLNQKIKETVGIDVPVLIKAIIRGIQWIIEKVFSFLQQFIPQNS